MSPYPRYARGKVPQGGDAFDDGHFASSQELQKTNPDLDMNFPKKSLRMDCLMLQGLIFLLAFNRLHDGSRCWLRPCALVEFEPMCHPEVPISPHP